MLAGELAFLERSHEHPTGDARHVALGLRRRRGGQLRGAPSPSVGRRSDLACRPARLVSLAFLLLGERQFQAMLLGALLTGLVGVALVTVLCRWTRTKEDAAIGIVLSTFFGAGVVLTSIIQNLPTQSSKAGLQTYIYGQAALMLRQDVWFIALVAAACLALVTALYKEFKVFSFDPGFARAQGWPTLVST